MRKDTIVLDGVTGYALEVLSDMGFLPEITELIDNSIYSFDAINTWKVTDTGSGLATIWSGKRGAVADNFAGLGRQDLTPEFMAEVRTKITADLLLTPFFFQHFPTKSHLYVGGENEDMLTDHLDLPFFTGFYNNSDIARMNAYLNSCSAMDFTALHLSGTDNAGHHNEGGHTLKNQHYVNKLIEFDNWIGLIKNAVDWHNGNSIIIICSDHGGDESGHGGQSYKERDSFVIWSNKTLSGYEIGATEEQKNHKRIIDYDDVPHLEDIAVSILHSEGAAIPGYMDGKFNFSNF